MKGKKAAVAETITWVVAFLIIFFIMFVFFLSSMYIASEPVTLKIDEVGDRLEFNKNSFYKDIHITPEKIKFNKKLQDDKE